MPYSARSVLKIIEDFNEHEIMYFMKAFPRKVIANCDKAKKRKKFQNPVPKILSLKTHLCRYLTGEGPYIGGAKGENSTEEYEKAVEKAVEKATREGLDPDASYEAFSRFSSTFADLLADMLRVHREREYRCGEYDRERAVKFFAHFFEDYRIESVTIRERRVQMAFINLQRISRVETPAELAVLRNISSALEDSDMYPTGYFFDALGFRNAGNEDFSTFRKRFRVRRALIALRTVFYFQFMYKKSVEAQFHPDRVRQRLEDEFREMDEEMRGE